MSKIKEWLAEKLLAIIFFAIIFVILLLIAIYINILVKNNALECIFDNNPMICVELKKRS